MSMHVWMHVCVCVAVHNPIQWNGDFVFFFIQLVRGREGYQEFPFLGDNPSFSVS